MVGRAECRTEQAKAATDKKAKEMEDRVIREFEDSSEKLRNLVVRCREIDEELEHTTEVPVTIEPEDSVVVEVDILQGTVRDLERSNLP